MSSKSVCPGTFERCSFGRKVTITELLKAPFGAYKRDITCAILKSIVRQCSRFCKGGSMQKFHYGQLIREHRQKAHMTLATLASLWPERMQACL